MKQLAWIALVLASVATGCSSAKAADEGVVLNGRCRCDGDAMCVQQMAANGGRPVACVSKVSSMGCTQFATSTRSCWPSSNVSGLCLCTGADSLAAAR